MKNFSLETLEYDELLRLIAENAKTPLGKNRLLDLKPFQEFDKLKTDLQALKEAIFLINECQVHWQFSGIFDPTQTISILKIQNASLDVRELLEISYLCKIALTLRMQLEPFKTDVPTLWEKVKKLPTNLASTVEKVERVILPSGEIDDSASPELAEIRREILRQRERLMKLMEKLIRSAGDAIQDAIITQRNDRFVIPVKADFRGSLQGVAHGFSSSGATVFIEPLETIELNNELQILKEREEQEIRRILFSLTEALRHQIVAVESAVNLVTEFDFIKAKVEFARKFDAIVPEVNHEETLLFEQARHPLLEKTLKESGKTIVPISFSLTKEKSAMIISGANAGGKTVVLKTTGLLALMALSGLPVTAKFAKIPFYKSVLADIGDHQSISANLSTFTSHISNIVQIIKDCENPALVLLDEVGTGTDPEEGAALGVAIVEYFHRKLHAQVMASTHYKNLKVYAANNPDVTNVSVEFNEKTLQPTYRLLIGVAGASSGIEIARRFGLPDEIVEKAHEELEVSTQKINDYLMKLKSEYKLAEDLRIALEEERKATAEKYELLEKEAEKKELERQQRFATALKETIESFERQAKAFIESLEDKATKAKLEKQLAAQKAEMKKRAVRSIQEMSDSEKRASSDSLKTSERGEPSVLDTLQEIKAGMKVLVKNLNQVGRVEKIEGKMAKVLIGLMRINERLENLQIVTEEKSEKPKSRETFLRFENENRSAELNLIGKKTFEIEDEIDKFLDKSYMSGFRRVRIVHGIGTGALKQAVRKFLKNHPHVERFTPAAQDQGGDGATIVELKQ